MKLILVIIALVVVIGGGYYFYTKSPTYTDNSASGQNPVSQGSDTKPAGTTGTPSTSGSFTGSFSNLAARGGNYLCTFHSVIAGADASGTVYVAGKKIRGDFSSKIQGTSVDTHMIQMDGYVYTWSPLMPTGIKAQVGTGVASGSTAGTQGQAQNANQSYTYDCKAWTPDSAIFTLPSIQFMTVSK